MKIKPHSVFETNHLTANLKQRSVRGGAATMIGQCAIFFSKTASVVVLARLLTPADFGYIAMVTAITGFASLFSDIGLSMATVQKGEINHAQVSTLFWINVAAGVSITLLTIALAPVVAWFYGEPQLTLITVAFSFIFILGGLTVQHQALLQRQMRFTVLATIKVVSTLIGIAVSIVSAFLGAGYWALVIMQTSSAVTTVLGVWIFCNWRPGRPRRHTGVRSMLVFGGNITAFNIVNYFARNADNILIGRFWGASSLGLYSKAYGLLMLPIRQINMPLASVVIPALSRLYGDFPKYRAYYLKATSLITLVSTPLVAFFIVCSDDLVLLLLGSQWTAAAGIFSVLGFSALIQPLYFTQGWLHISSGRSDRYFRWGLVGSSLIVLAFFAGLPYGPIGVATAYTLITWIIIFPCMWYAGRSAGIHVGTIFAAAGKNIAAGLSSIAFSFFLLEQIRFPSAWANLMIGFIFICSIYGICLLLIYRNLTPLRQILDVAKIFIQPAINSQGRL